MPHDDIPELAEKPPASPRKRRRWLLPALLGLLVLGAWWQRERLPFLPSTGKARADLEAEVDRLTDERDALSAELTRQAEDLGAASALDQAFETTRELSDEILRLQEELQSLEARNLNLADRLAGGQRQSDREIERLEDDIERLEALARREREQWDAESARLRAANENLDRQNAILKDRLSSSLMAAVDLPPDSNAAAALDRGNLEIDALERRIAVLEKQLAESGQQRNLLARSLQETREARSAASLAATLSVDAGDRVMTDLSERLAALKRDADKSLAERERERSEWNAERARLVAARDDLKSEVISLRERLAEMSIDSPAEPRPSPEPTEKVPEPVAKAPSPPEAPVTSPTLAEEPASLSESARPVFDNLQSLDDDDEALELSDAYARIARETGGQLVLTLPFPAGSAVLDEEARERILSLVAASPGSRFLAIGYASSDGSESRNRELSSRRALTAAEALAAAGPTQPVEAVYFGQTQRFDPRHRAANRVVEIWKID